MHLVNKHNLIGKKILLINILLELWLTEKALLLECAKLYILVNPG